jgi:hypothetical protein
MIVPLNAPFADAAALLAARVGATNGGAIAGRGGGVVEAVERVGSTVALGWRGWTPIALFRAIAGDSTPGPSRLAGSPGLVAIPRWPSIVPFIGAGTWPSGAGGGGIADLSGAGAAAFTAGAVVPCFVMKKLVPHFGQRIFMPLSGMRRGSSSYGALQASHATLIMMDAAISLTRLTAASRKPVDSALVADCRIVGCHLEM